MAGKSFPTIDNSLRKITNTIQKWGIDKGKPPINIEAMHAEIIPKLMLCLLRLQTTKDLNKKINNTINIRIAKNPISTNNKEGREIGFIF